MIIICGKTIAEVERDLELAKMAMASGAAVGIGGADVADAEQALVMLKNMGVQPPTPIAENEPCCGCCCGCCEDEYEDEYVDEYEDEEEEDTLPIDEVLSRLSEELPMPLVAMVEHILRQS